MSPKPRADDAGRPFRVAQDLAHGGGDGRPGASRVLAGVRLRGRLVEQRQGDAVHADHVLQDVAHRPLGTRRRRSPVGGGAPGDPGVQAFGDGGVAVGDLTWLHAGSFSSPVHPPASTSPVSCKRANGRSLDHSARGGIFVMAFVGRERWSLRTSFWLVVAAQVLLFAGSNLPTPLFPIYEDRYGFGPGTVTLLFGVYVAGPVADVASCSGPVADRFGRRPLLVAGHRLPPSSAPSPSRWPEGVAWLFAGEIIYGIGAGMVMACVAAAIRELHPAQDGAGAALAAIRRDGRRSHPRPPCQRSAWPRPSRGPPCRPTWSTSCWRRCWPALLVRIPEPRPVTPRTVPRSRALHVPAGIRRAPVHRRRGCRRRELHGRRLGVRPLALVPARGASRPRHRARRGRAVRGGGRRA